MFPPGAYHSEGHQDGISACLYFALMKKLLGDRFGFAVLDDVAQRKYAEKIPTKTRVRIYDRNIPLVEWLISNAISN